MLLKRHTREISIIGFLLALVTAMLIMGGCGASSSDEASTVRVGTVSGSSADAAMFIAVEKGYFDEQGINIEFQPFDSGARMVAPLGNGQMDIASGSMSAGLYNAIAREVELSIVADKARVVPPNGFQALVVRKDLVDSGEFTGYEDLEGLTVAISAVGNANELPLYLMLREGGLDFSDIQLEEIGFAEQVTALENGSIDAGIMIEPSITQALDSGAAVRFAGTDTVFPDQQTSAILYGDQFAQDNPDVARNFMIAYIKGVRDYNDALEDGQLSGPNADEVASILAEYTNIDDPEFYKEIYLHGVDPDGQLNLDSLQEELQFWKDQGHLESDDVTVQEAIDSSYVDAALEELGPHEPSE
jgi:NitT/TauT family transport system substrate-binding protein